MKYYTAPKKKNKIMQIDAICIRETSRLTCDFEISLCGEPFPSPDSDMESRPDVVDNVALEMAGWSWERDDKEGVGERLLGSFSTGVSRTLDKPGASGTGSWIRVEVLLELF